MAFDATLPAASSSLRTSNPQILANWVALQAAINAEHIFSGTAGSTQTGYHTQGSARCFFQAGEPATRIDTSAFTSADFGSLWVDSDDNAVYVLTAIGPVVWTAISTEIITLLLASPRTFLDTLGVTGNFDVNGNFTVAAASGNALSSGTISSTGTLRALAALIADGATTLNSTLAVTGGVTMASELVMGGVQISGLAAGVNSTDAVRFGQYAPIPLTTQDYTAFPNDFLIKRGSGTATTSNPTITFDSSVPFDAGLTPIVITQRTGTNPVVNEVISVNTITATTFNADAAQGSPTFDYIAIGRR